MESADYKVRLDVFEGPLDLLLYLVKKDEVDIYDISMERITAQYLEFLDAFRMLDLDIAGEFLVMAANLIYIKSRSLLPAAEQPPEESAEEDDPRWELIRQLVEYRKFKEAAEQLGEREIQQARYFQRIPEKPQSASEGTLMLREAGIFDLINAVQRVLKRVSERQEDLREIFEEHFTVGEKMEHLLAVVAGDQPVAFQDLFSEDASRAEVVVTFLALLELIRLKQLTITQDEAMGEILVHRIAGASR